MVVGITGGIGSGKSYVAQCFLSLPNTVYYHADEEAKKLMNSSEEIRTQLIQTFGDQSYVDGKLNRPYIASIVFSNPEELQKLNAAVHPAVRKHFKQFVDTQTRETLIIYENAILFESKSDVVCDFVITVTAPKDIKIERVMQRDQVSKEEVLKRMSNQWIDTQKILLSNYMILNISKQETLLKVQKIHNILTEKGL